ncbi:Rid family hydrolase [Herbiconiux sp. L3-i23]|uniref:Rid family hydrolase n=1 Tax=Herbiconiux sp. L3-i23 TaxID=2905871 RepID=UPI0020695813|nr:Rid family hydrolase [Herbiconiux sp. L3-i23]BDI24106.1 hypothetical protein L3i23_28820 [Herbiconiux sp. L3-i23]
MQRRRLSSGYRFEEEYGYSRAVRAGDHIYVSGTTARGDALEGDTATQMVDALEHIAAALAELGSSLDDVVRCVVYLVDLGDYDLIAPVHARAFGVARPASTLLQVDAMVPATARIEIEVTAVAAA